MGFSLYIDEMGMLRRFVQRSLPSSATKLYHVRSRLSTGLRKRGLSRILGQTGGGGTPPAPPCAFPNFGTHPRKRGLSQMLDEPSATHFLTFISALHVKIGPLLVIQGRQGLSQQIPTSYRGRRCWRKNCCHRSPPRSPCRDTSSRR